MPGNWIRFDSRSNAKVAFVLLASGVYSNGNRLPCQMSNISDRSIDVNFDGHLRALLELQKDNHVESVGKLPESFEFHALSENQDIVNAALTA